MVLRPDHSVVVVGGDVVVQRGTAADAVGSQGQDRGAGGGSCGSET